MQIATTAGADGTVTYEARVESYGECGLVIAHIGEALTRAGLVEAGAPRIDEFDGHVFVRVTGKPAASTPRAPAHTDDHDGHGRG